MSIPSTASHSLRREELYPSPREQDKIDAAKEGRKPNPHAGWWMQWMAWAFQESATDVRIFTDEDGEKSVQLTVYGHAPGRHKATHEPRATVSLSSYYDLVETKKLRDRLNLIIEAMET